MAKRKSPPRRRNCSTLPTGVAIPVHSITLTTDGKVQAVIEDSVLQRLVQTGTAENPRRRKAARRNPKEKEEKRYKVVLTKRGEPRNVSTFIWATTAAKASQQAKRHKLQIIPSSSKPAGWKVLSVREEY